MRQPSRKRIAPAGGVRRESCMGDGSAATIVCCVGLEPSASPRMNERTNYPRDLVGYGRHPPHPHWPGGARIAVQFVLNYEEGAENSVLHGDAASETFLSEIIGATDFANRHLSMESLYQYGGRA